MIQLWIAFLILIAFEAQTVSCTPTDVPGRTQSCSRCFALIIKKRMGARKSASFIRWILESNIIEQQNIFSRTA